LNIDFGINNEREDCKVGIVWEILMGGDKGKGIWMMGFITYMK
jgi:hypothetical protein